MTGIRHESQVALIVRSADQVYDHIFCLFTLPPFRCPDGDILTPPFTGANADFV